MNISKQRPNDGAVEVSSATEEHADARVSSFSAYKVSLA